MVVVFEHSRLFEICLHPLIMTAKFVYIIDKFLHVQHIRAGFMVCNSATMQTA